MEVKKWLRNRGGKTEKQSMKETWMVREIKQDSREWEHEDTERGNHKLMWRETERENWSTDLLFTAKLKKKMVSVEQPASQEIETTNQVCYILSNETSRCEKLKLTHISWGYVTNYLL